MEEALGVSYLCDISSLPRWSRLQLPGSLRSTIVSESSELATTYTRQMRPARDTSLLKRSWSIVALAALFCLVISRTGNSELFRAIAAAVSLGLVAQFWVVQRPFVKTKRGLALLTVILCLPVLGSLWLGLNVVRFYSYDAGSGGNAYGAVVRLQQVIEQSALVTGLVVFYWSVGELASLLGKRISRGLVGRKKTWWNTPLTGTWMLGSGIGFAVSALIASSLLRWALIALGVWGCLFALLFRMSRKDGEI